VNGDSNTSSAACASQIPGAAADTGEKGRHHALDTGADGTTEAGGAKHRPMNSDTEANADHCWARRYQTLHRIQLAVRYHGKRERFFDGSDRFLTAFTALAATSAISVLAQRAFQQAATAGSASPTWLELTLGAMTALFAMVAMVYAPGIKARMHGQLGSDFRKLWADCIAAGEDWKAEQCDSFAARVLQIEVGEPPTLAALVTQCENEIAVAEGQPDRIRVLGRWRSFWKHWWNFDTTALPLLDKAKVRAMLSVEPDGPG
jgi:hypothetical protein